MKKTILLLCLLASHWMMAQTLRPPAYPLITHDPYFSIWSNTDQLNESATRHWTGKPQALEGIIDVDGVQYQFLGAASVQYATVVPTANQEAYLAKYTFTQPQQGWELPTFDDAAWQYGKAPLGDGASSNPLKVNTLWKTPDVWYRREILLGEFKAEDLLLQISHDDDVEVFVNGVLAYQCGPCYIAGYELYDLLPEAKKL